MISNEQCMLTGSHNAANVSAMVRFKIFTRAKVTLATRLATGFSPVLLPGPVEQKSLLTRLSC
jgi:hypothetical protein